MHSRRRLTIDPRIPTIPRRSTPGFHRPGRYSWQREGRGGAVADAVGLGLKHCRKGHCERQHWCFDVPVVVVMTIDTRERRGRGVYSISYIPVVV